MKLLLDEMYSPEIARQLEAKGHDVQSIQGDRSELKALDDELIVERMAAEQRGVITNNIKDFMSIHNAWLAAGREHSGLLFSVDKRMPRSQKAIGLWVRTLDALLRDHPDQDALKNSIHFLVPS